MKTPNKLPAPYKHQLWGPDGVGAFHWRHIQSEGDLVYERTFYSLRETTSFLEDRYGVRWANTVLADNAAFHAPIAHHVA